MSRKDTQNARLLAYLIKHHFITRLEAAREPLFIMNLWQRVSELELPKNGGHKIDRRYVDLPDGGSRLQYWLRQGTQQKRAA